MVTKNRSRNFTSDPEDINFKRSIANQSQSTIQPLTNNTRQFENFENQFLEENPQNFQDSQMTQDLSDTCTQNFPPESSFNLLEFFESILPVVHENKETLNDPIMRPNSTGLNLESSLPFSLRIFGKFETIYISERKLTFRKKEFLEVE